MAGTYLAVGPAVGGGGGGGGGSIYWKDGAANFASLPTGGADGEVRIAIDTGIAYRWNTSAWGLLKDAIAPAAAADTDSLDLSIDGSGTLTADLRLSGVAASADHIKAVSTVQVGGDPGLHVETPQATAAQTGAIVAQLTTAADFLRGDGTFTALNTDSMATVNTAAASGKLGELVSAEQGSLTATGVGASGVFGNAVSLSLGAGTWLLQGQATLSENGANLTTGLEIGISDAANGSTLSTHDIAIAPYLVSSTSDARVFVAHEPISQASTTTWYLNTKFTYTSGAPQHMGKLWAIRIR